MKTAQLTTSEINKLKRAKKDLNNRALNAWDTKSKFDKCLTDFATKYHVPTQVIYDLIP